jgi:hypothetical protein
MYGLGLLALGLAMAVAELSPLDLAETGSVAALAAGVVALVAILAAPRTEGSDHGAGGPDGATVPGTGAGPDLDL